MKRYRSSVRNDERLAHLPDLELTSQPDLDSRCIFVDTSREYQTHLGFGGALTRCSVENLEEMGDENAEKVLEDYYSSENGIGYSMVRHTIGSSDFGSYSYDYLPEGATDLKGIDFSEEERNLKYAKMIDRIGGDVISLASVWSPPAYMKENRERYFGGRLRPECREDWAEYIALYLEYMKKHQHPISYINSQNEPEANQLWESMHLDADEEGLLIRDYLVPALKRHGLDTKVSIWDHNKDEMVRRANVTLSVSGVDQLVSAISYHGYVSDAYKNVELTHSLHSDKLLFFTEWCVEWANAAYGQTEETRASEGKAAERYAIEILESMNAGASAFVDWNLIVNDQGGPTWIRNFCDAPVQFLRVDKMIRHNLSFYYIGQLSKFLKRGARRLYCANDFEKDIYTAAYRNPDGDIVVFALNTDWLKEPVLLIDKVGRKVSLPPHSITTFTVEKGELEK